MGKFPDKEQLGSDHCICGKKHYLVRDMVARSVTGSVLEELGSRCSRATGFLVNDAKGPF